MSCCIYPIKVRDSNVDSIILYAVSLSSGCWRRSNDIACSDEEESQREAKEVVREDDFEGRFASVWFFNHHYSIYRRLQSFAITLLPSSIKYRTARLSSNSFLNRQCHSKTYLSYSFLLEPAHIRTGQPKQWHTVRIIFFNCWMEMIKRNKENKIKSREWNLIGRVPIEMIEEEEEDGGNKRTSAGVYITVCNCEGVFIYPLMYVWGKVSMV